jgi:hypothetical protein
MMAMTGDELGQLIKGLIETPAAVRDKVREAIKPSNMETLKGAKAGD